MPNIFGQLVNAQLENKSSDYSAGTRGRIWWDTALLQVRSDDGTNIRALLRNDQACVFGNNGTANSNIRLNRAAAGVLQLVLGGDTTAEGSLSTAVAQLSSRVENYATGALPAAASAGRLLWDTSLSILKVDTGAALKQILQADAVQIITNKDIDGGTASDAKRITLPKDTKTNLDGLSRKAGTLVYATDSQKVYYDNGTVLKAVGTGNGSGINYISANPDAEVDTTGWATYADAAGATPVNGTGGSPTTTWTRSTVAPLRDTASFILTKDAANRQGEGASYDFTIDSADKNKILSISFDHEVTSGTFVAGDSSDVRVFIYDVTNTTLVTPSVTTIQSAPGKFQATFATTDSTSYRLILHVATTSASAYVFKVDNVIVGPQQIVYGPAMTDEQDESSLFTFTGLGTVSGTSVFTRQLGNKLHVRGTVVSGTSTATAAKINLPSKYVIDSARMLAAQTARVGFLNRITNVSGATGAFATNYADVIFYDGSDTASMYVCATVNSNTAYTKANGDAVFISGETIDFQFEIPIVGWSTNVVAANSSVFNISNVLANGTRVTATPTALGEYRSYLRNASNRTYTEVNGTPSTLPTAADGIKIWGGASFTANDTNNEPSKYEIFVGKNKTIRAQFYASTGRTGFLSIEVGPNWAGSTDVGMQIAYDPTTGIVSVTKAYVFGNTAGAIGFDKDGGVVTDGYFDIIVSENALTVQQESDTSEIVLDTGNGAGAVNTLVRRFTNTRKNSGPAITYADSANNGASFTINRKGKYAIMYADTNAAANSNFGITVNCSSLATAIPSMTYTQGKRAIAYIASSTRAFCQVTLNLEVGDVVRANIGDANINGADDNTIFSIVKIS